MTSDPVRSISWRGIGTGGSNLDRHQGRVVPQAEQHALLELLERVCLVTQHAREIGLLVSRVRAAQPLVPLAGDDLALEEGLLGLRSSWPVAGGC